MRIWQSSWQRLIYFVQENPPRFMEIFMLLLGIVLLLIWGNTERWPYLALSLSYAIGASLSILIRESLVPYLQPSLNQIVAVLLLLTSICALTDLIPYF